MKIDKKTRIGTYTLIMCAIVLAALVIVNVLVINLPSKLTKLDVTPQSFYTLSEETADAVSGIGETVNIYLICSGGEDQSQGSGGDLPKLSLFLERYSELNENLEFTLIDPVKSPTFTDKYSTSGIGDYSIIVESEKRYKVLNFSDLYFYSDGTTKIPADQYQSYLYYYYSSTGQYPELSINFDGESLMTSALDYVTTDRIPVIYTLTEHGEGELSASLSEQIENSSMELKSLNLLTAGAVPEDAECVIINIPQSDINTGEAAALGEFLEKGGMLFLDTLYAYTDFPNLMGVLGTYGLSPERALVVEGDTSMHFNGYPVYMLPSANTESPLTAALAGSSNLFMYLAHGINTDGETEKNVNVESLFTTSSEAYTVPLDSESLEKTESSAEGPFDLAVYAEDGDSGARIVWFASSVLEDQANQMVSGGNYKYFDSIMNAAIERESVVRNIPSNVLANEALVVSNFGVFTWGAVFVVILPLAFAVLGVAYWAVRRRR